MKRFTVLFCMTLLLTLLSPVYGQRSSSAGLSKNVDRIMSKINEGQYTNIHGILLWKDGKIIGEQYWNGWDRDRTHMLQSATKSITGLLTGIAIKEGFISDENRMVLDFFSEDEYDKIRFEDERKQALTLENLLTMRTGMVWVEYPYGESHLAQMNSERNEWTRFMLNRPMQEVPGESYAYNSGGVILLAGIIREATDMTVQEFSRRHLFEPLGITTAEWWFTDNTGLPHTGGGLRLSSGDMLKIGQLVLQCGEWNGRQILDCEFVNKLYQNYLSDSLPEIAGYNRGYSLLWHVFPMDPETDMKDPAENFIAAWGAHGQWLMVFPSHNMVAVFIGGTQTFEEEVEPVRIVYEDLLKTDS